MSRILDRSALRMKSLNCFRDGIFLASDESLFHSLGSGIAKGVLSKGNSRKSGKNKVSVSSIIG